MYSVQKTGKNMNTNRQEIKTFIGMNMLMGIIKLPQYFDYWSSVLWFPAIADAMSSSCFSQLRQFLYYVDNNSDHDSDDKLVKIKPIMEAVRDECVKIEPELVSECGWANNSFKKQIYQDQQYHPKKTRKWDFKNLVRAGSKGFIYNFYFYSGREEVNEDSGYSHLQKSAQIVTMLGVPRHQGYMCYFDNWFSKLELFIYFGWIENVHILCQQLFRIFYPPFQTMSARVITQFSVQFEHTLCTSNSVLTYFMLLKFCQW